jgi:hypothetical protein
MRLHPREAGTRGEARSGTRRGHADARTSTSTSASAKAGAGRSAWSGVRVHRGVGIGRGWLLLDGKRVSRRHQAGRLVTIRTGTGLGLTLMMAKTRIVRVKINEEGRRVDESC